MFTPFTLRACGRTLICDRPQVVGVLNVTPDSFSDGGQFLEPDVAVARALSLVEAGADWLDIGAESTRPGATPVSEADEIARLLPVLERVSARVSIPISIDTMKAAVARRALDAGAIVINDVSAMQFDQEMAPLVAARGAGVILMHMQGTPQTMQRQPHYENVVQDVRNFLDARVRAAAQAGIDTRQIVLDPGFGFGKLVEHNVALLQHLSAFRSLGCPVMVGLSRKTFLGRLSDRPVQDRMMATAAAVALAVERGAGLLRVHDVAAMRDVVAVTMAAMSSGEPRPSSAPSVA